jgi:hypothetical protein
MWCFGHEHSTGTNAIRYYCKIVSVVVLINDRPEEILSATTVLRQGRDDTCHEWSQIQARDSINQGDFLACSQS